MGKLFFLQLVWEMGCSLEPKDSTILVETQFSSPPTSYTSVHPIALCGCPLPHSSAVCPQTGPLPV